MDVTTVLVVLGIVAAIGWGLAAWQRRIDRDVVLRGLLHGLVAAGVLVAITALLTGLVLNGREFLGGPIGFGEAFALGLIAGAIIGGGLFLAGVALMPYGLLVRQSRDWPLYGTWVAVVVIVFSLGLGWTAFQSFQEQGPPQPTPAPTRPA